MKNLICLFIILYSLTAFSAPSEIILSLGESSLLPVHPKSSVWIQDRTILKAEALGGRLNIKGLTEGLTNVRIDDNLYRVQVIHPGKRAAFSDLKKQLSKIIGLSVEVGDGDLLVTGRLYRLQDWIRLAELLTDSGVSYQMRAALSPALQSESQQHFTDLLSKAKVPPQSIIFVPSPEIRVSGNDIILRKYQKILRPYGINIIKDQSSLEIAPTVKVQITVAEVRHESALLYGIKWPAAYRAAILGEGAIEFDKTLLDVQAFEKKGYGKILASPNLVCRSGSEAEFLAGGEFPIKIANYKVQDVVWKRYGILLRVKPKADASGRMSLSIDTEISTLDKGSGIDNVPGILTNRVSSHFDLTRTQTIALSGLLKKEGGDTSEGLPMLSRIPILGPLFSSKDYSERRSELVIFVRPSIMSENEESESSLQHIGQVGN
ncbi:type II and III secretion system protein [Bdellovibrio sp. SKB1291214]|uniref:type II and III secretion system protein n=1 Tax=Bdellovibrio sp. SKB1291214 TaxID=1732569 RepID=UPI00223EC1D1|nr:type II and III secretion system protein [Bdellovibrio sp. SKB1291214]UYL09175.1 type II and III secretion system protein [Bdellovibrio sp. SKB1291214]